MLTVILQCMFPSYDASIILYSTCELSFSITKLKSHYQDTNSNDSGPILPCRIRNLHNIVSCGLLHHSNNAHQRLNNKLVSIWTMRLI